MIDVLDRRRLYPNHKRPWRRCLETVGIMESTSRSSFDLNLSGWKVKQSLNVLHDVQATYKLGSMFVQLWVHENMIWNMFFFLSLEIRPTSIKT